jgi:hypothetical protein
MTISYQGSLEPNTNTISKFLSELTRGWDNHEVMEIRCIVELKPPKNQRFDRHDIDNAVRFLSENNKAGYNVYVTVNPVPKHSPSNAKDSDIKRAFYAFVDADEKGAAERVRECSRFEKSMEVVTGTKPHVRNHVYYRFNKPMTDMNAWKQLQKLLSDVLVTDRAIHNPSRIMRVAGSVSYPSKRKIELGYQPEITRLLMDNSYVE